MTRQELMQAVREGAPSMTDREILTGQVSMGLLIAILESCGAFDNPSETQSLAVGLERYIEDDS